MAKVRSQASNNTKMGRPKWNIFLLLGLLLVQCSVLLSQAQPAKKEGPSRRAALIRLDRNLDNQSMARIKQQMDQAVQKQVDVIIFELDGAGQSYTRHVQLARQIALLSQDGTDAPKTVAYIPREAKGVTLLPALACQTIIMDRFAQFGQARVASAEKDRDRSGLAAVDDQTLATQLTSFARAAGHDPLLARAMVDRRLMLYQIESGDETQIVDQHAFETAMRDPNTDWRMVGRGPIVGSDEVLLLDGTQAQELGLAHMLAADQQDLLNQLDAELIPVTAIADIAIEQGDPNEPAMRTGAPMAVDVAVVAITETIDPGLYQSIRRRTNEALANGAKYIIYDIDTFGGRVDAAIDISEYLKNEVAPKAHTVAYVPAKALSAGALISVACNDIIMGAHATLGDCAPIVMGGTLEGTEREKAESFLRATFESSARANDYPVALCRAMVSMRIEVYKVYNNQTDQYEYFETDELDGLDPFVYEVESKQRVVTDDELLTVTAEEALEYGLSRHTADSLDLAVEFLEQRDHIAANRPFQTFEINWSEEMVRWITSPTVQGIVFMIALLGIYAELNSPGLGLPGAIAVAALVVLFGSKYLIGMANWWEIAMVVIGLGLLMLEIFVIPGFGIAGISGVALIIFGLGAMMVDNPPEKFPMPQTPWDWQSFRAQVLGTLFGFFGFIVFAWLLSRYLPKIPIANKLILVTPETKPQIPTTVDSSPLQSITPDIDETPPVQIGEEGIALTPLRPAGKAKFGSQRLDVVAQSGYVNTQTKVTVVQVEGNRIVVKAIS